MLGKKPLLFLIVVMSMFGPISTDMFLAALSEMEKYFATDTATLKIALYGFMFSLAISVLLMGPLSDKYGRRKILTISMIIYIAMSLACCFTDNIWVFIGFRIIQAIGGGGALAISMALIKDCFSGDEMKSVISLNVALAIIGPIAAPVLGTAMINLVDWKATFWVPAIIGGICLVLGLFLPANLPEKFYEGSVFDSIKNMGHIARNKSFMIFLLMYSVFVGGQLAYVSESSYIYEGFGKDNVFFALALASTLIIGLAFMKVIQHFEDSIGNKRMLWIFLALGILSFAITMALGQKEWYFFMLGIIPLITLTTTARAFGTNILMRQYDSDNGAVSSLLNFTAFMYCCLGMLLSGLPWGDHVTCVGAVIGICCVVYAILWGLYKGFGCKLKEFDF